MSFRIGSPETTGRALTALGVIAISPDALLTRLVTADVWTVIWWRAALTALAIIAVLTIHYRGALAARVRESLSMPATLVAPLWGVGTIFFVLAVSNTAVANVLVIIAAGPLFGAFLSRVFLKERIRAETWIASFSILVGLIAVFGESFSAGSLFGDACALGTTLCATIAFVVLRRCENPSPLVLAAAGSLVAVILVTPAAEPWSIDLVDFGYLVVLGVGILPVAYALIFLGPRYIPAPEVGLIMLLETALGPLWVWLVIGEVPSMRVAASGALIVLTVAVHSVIAMRRG